jgi:hypothetical protein
MRRKRVAILISGRGSNMSALIEAAKAPDYPAEIVGVFSNRVAAKGLEIAAAEGIATKSLAQSSYESREAFDGAIDQLLASCGSSLRGSSSAGRGASSTSTRLCCRFIAGSTPTRGPWPTTYPNTGAACIS